MDRLEQAPLGRRPSAEEILREIGGKARLVVYLASAPGAGKTRRLLEDARRLHDNGQDVVIGAVETKGRPDLDALLDCLSILPPRTATLQGATFEEFDLAAAIARKPTFIILDELAHDNLQGSVNPKRWQDALALRDAGITVLGAFNIAHLETVAAVAEKLIGYPVREIIPLSFLQAADEVIALDSSPQLLQLRLESGKLVAPEDVERARTGIFREPTLEMLRQLLLRTIDDLTVPTVSAEKISTATAFVFPDVEAAPFLRRSAALASALDLALEIAPVGEGQRTGLEELAREYDAEILSATVDLAKGDVSNLRASLLCIPAGAIATKLVSRRFSRDIFVVGRGQTYIGESPLVTNPYGLTAGDRMRVGYGKLYVYLGAAAGSGKTYAMLDRAHQLKAAGVDVVAGYIETHGRKETAALVEGLEVLPRKVVSGQGMTYQEFDRDALIARRPKVVLIDELAHTNAPGSIAKKRYEDVLAVLRAGINVVTTLNVQHLEALSDAVFRLTGTVVRETLPDGILALADEVILIDVTPETLRERLREGKIYPRERIEAALSNFFRADNLLALRELALREALRARNRQRIPAPFERLLLSVAQRQPDIALIKRVSRIAARLEVEFAVAHVSERGEKSDPAIEGALRDAAAAEHATWLRRTDESNVPQALLSLARQIPETTIVVTGTLRSPGVFARKAFARRLLDAGARELLVLAPRETGKESFTD